MSILSRPAKQGGATTYQEKVAQGYKTILASEMDADLNTLYDAWNDGVDAVNIRDNAITADKIAPNQIGPRELVDNLTGADILAVDAITARELAPDSVGTVELVNGSVTAAKLAPDARSLWTDTGTALRPTAVRNVELGPGTIKATLECAPTGTALFTSNHPWTPQDLTKASWALHIDAENNAFNVVQRAPGAAAGAGTIPFQVRGSDGKTLCSLADTSVLNGMLAVGAAVRQVQPLAMPVGLTIAGPSGFFTAFAFPSLTTRGGLVAIVGTIGWRLLMAAGNYHIGFAWQRDGATLPGSAMNFETGANSACAIPMPTPLLVDTTAPAGAHVYWLVAVVDVAGASLIFDGQNAGTLFLVEFA